MGGDDFLAKPFDLAVLSAKVQADIRGTAVPNQKRQRRRNDTDGKGHIRGGNALDAHRMPDVNLVYDVIQAVHHQRQRRRNGEFQQQPPDWLCA